MKHLSITPIKEVNTDNQYSTESSGNDAQVKYNAKESVNPEKTNLPWWECYDDNELLLQKLESRVKYLKDDMREFYNQARIYNYLYSQKDDTYKDAKKVISEFFHNPELLNLSFNITQIAVDSHYNNLIKSTPKVTFQGKNAPEELITHAMELDRYIFNCFRKGMLFPNSRLASKASMITNIGHVKTEYDMDNMSFNYHKISSYNFLVERPYEGSRKREEFIEKKKVSLWQLKELVMMTNDREKMNKFEEIYKDNDSHSSIEVYEAYKSKKYKVIFTKQLLIHKEKWMFDFVPYTIFAWDTKEEGYVQRGITETVEDCQNTINWLLYIILNNAELYQANYLAIPVGSDYGDQITNEFASILEYNPADGGRPFQLQPSILHPQYFQFLSQVFMMGLKKARVSQAQQDGELPKNLRASGTALTTFNNMDQSRFVANKEDFQDCFLDITRKTVEMAMEKYAGKEEFLSYAKSNKEDFFEHMQIYPESIINESPQNKIALAQQLFNAQQISLEQYLEIVQIKPEEIPNVVTSRLKRNQVISKRINNAIKKGAPLVFDDYLGIQEQEDIALKKYDELMNMSNKFEEDTKVKIVRGYLDQIAEKKKLLMQQQEKQLQTQLALAQAQKDKQKAITKLA